MVKAKSGFSPQRRISDVVLLARTVGNRVIHDIGNGLEHTVEPVGLLSFIGFKRIDPPLDDADICDLACRIPTGPYCFADQSREFIAAMLQFLNCGSRVAHGTVDFENLRCLPIKSPPHARRIEGFRDWRVSTQCRA